MLANEVRDHVIVPSLKATGLWSPAAEVLIFGTGLIETNYNHLTQMGHIVTGGLGFWQCEAKTYADILKYLGRPENKKLNETITASLYYVMMPRDERALMTNLSLGALICRVHYYRIPEELPEATDAAGLAKYYKRWYNTVFGKADITLCQQLFQQIIDGKEKP